jgi:hypothetical protein
MYICYIILQVRNPSGFRETLTWTASPFERVSEWTVRDSAMVRKEGGSMSSVSYRKKRRGGVPLLSSMWLLRNDISILLGKDVSVVGVKKLVVGFSRRADVLA